MFFFEECSTSGLIFVDVRLNLPNVSPPPSNLENKKNYKCKADDDSKAKTHTPIDKRKINRAHINSTNENNPSTDEMFPPRDLHNQTEQQNDDEKFNFNTPTNQRSRHQDRIYSPESGLVESPTTHVLDIMPPGERLINIGNYPNLQDNCPPPLPFEN